MMSIRLMAIGCAVAFPIAAMAAPPFDVPPPFQGNGGDTINNYVLNYTPTLVLNLGPGATFVGVRQHNTAPVSAVISGVFIGVPVMVNPFRSVVVNGNRVSATAMGNSSFISIVK